MTACDKIIVLFLIIASAAAMLAQSFFLNGEAGERVVITVDGEDYAGYDFADIKGTKTVEINTKFGSNTVKIDSNSVRVVEADCPDKLDVKAGKISKTNQMIVCLPNRIMIEIKGGKQTVDRVTY